MTELELRQVEATNEAFDRAHRIVPPNIVLNPSRKQTGLFSALAGLERMIRHEPNRTSTPENSRYSCPVSSGKSAIAGRISRERSAGTQTNDAGRGRRSRVVLTPRRWRQVLREAHPPNRVGMRW